MSIVFNSNRAIVRPFLFVVLLCLAVGTACGRAVEITVFAAASLTESLKALGTAYEKQAGDKVTFNFGSSSMLARQIEEGAPADVFFSADEATMDALEKRNRIVKETRKRRLGNSLVIVVAADSPLRIHSATNLCDTNITHVALADPKTVPAGIYSKTYLEKLGLWSAIEKKVVPTDNVRAALAAVESGNAEAGMVYKTDAAISRKVKVAFVVPVAENPDISYPMAVVKESKQPEAAKKFLQYLASEDAASVFEKFGFIVRK
jgi:molybdate transport system substrate-binding protein